MSLSGRVAQCTLPGGRTLEFWDGGDPSGRALIVHPGTPSTHVAGRWASQAAREVAVRLVAVSRPGYAESTPMSVPSLRAVGEDTAALARAIGLERYGVVGISGGGPFALATAIADADRVRALGVVGGIGPWRELDEPSEFDMVDRESLALLDGGEVAAAHDAVMRRVEGELGYLRDLGDHERVDAALADWDVPIRGVVKDPAYRALMAENLAAVLGNLEGYVFDNLAWGGHWDVDRSDVTVPTFVFDTDQPEAHGPWYAEGIHGAELVIRPGESHLDICDGHWPEVLAGLLRIWR